MSLAPQAVVHDVLFAENDDELIGVAGDRLADALVAGDAAMVVVTPEHERLLAERIRSVGIDLDEARADGSVLLLDAATTLGEITPGGAFDVEAFDRVVGDSVRARAARGPLFVFGEMVALLFDAGRAAEAMELESAWNRLLQVTSVRVLCAYPGVLLDDPDQAVHVGALCGMHSSVLAESPFRRSWTFLGDGAAGSQARRLVSNALRARGVPEGTFYDTLSVVTELVANAVTHGGTPVSLEMTIDHDVVAVRVADRNPAAPYVRTDGKDAGRKVWRGLHLVEQLAHRWGFETRGPGKVVWAELAR